MIKKTQMISELVGFAFMDKLNKTIEAWQNEGLNVDVQYSIDKFGNHTALVIGATVTNSNQIIRCLSGQNEVGDITLAPDLTIRLD